MTLASNRFSRWLIKRFRSHLSIMLVPNSSHGKVKSWPIPFAIILVIIAIIGYNLYVYVSFTAQIYQIYDYRQEIGSKNHLIAKLSREAQQVKPSLQKGLEIDKSLIRLKKEETRLNNTWERVQQKSGRKALIASRSGYLRVDPYKIKELPSTGSTTSLDQLNHNLKQLDRFVAEESKAQKELLQELLAYESKLDHTPSIWPVVSYNITSGFGMRVHPVYRTYTGHLGVDIKAAIGTPVRVAADGVVKFAGWESGYGNLIRINHGNGLETRYGHNSRLLVHVGQIVHKGQIISYSGNTGITTGPHLHYEVRLNGRPISPMQFLK
ncbi:MAG: M23 family metallopeptidase [Bacteroidota bacterium]